MSDIVAIRGRRKEYPLDLTSLSRVGGRGVSSRAASGAASRKSDDFVRFFPARKPQNGPEIPGQIRSQVAPHLTFRAGHDEQRQGSA